jgi:penicillin V acylase-like amidase (Ntn superfamily)
MHVLRNKGCAVFFFLLASTFSAAACTSFVLSGEYGPVFATNLDNRLQEGLIYVNPRGMVKSGWEASSAGEYARWTSKYGSVSFNFAGYQITWAGMNEAGLVMSTMSLGETSVPEPDERPSMGNGFWMQYHLDNSATIDEVITAAEKIRMGDTVDHYLVCDAGGDVAVIEFLHGKMVVHRGGKLPIPVLTNHTYRDLVKSERWWTLKRLFSDRYPANPSLKRFQLGARNVKSFDPGGKEDVVACAFRTLHEVSGQAVNAAATQWSIVFDIAERRILFRTRTYDPMRFLDFRSLDFTAGTPVLMMNVHEKLSGDAAGALIPYSHEVTLEHYYRFFRDYGINVSPDLTRRLVEHLESFSPSTESSNAISTPVLEENHSH